GCAPLGGQRLRQPITLSDSLWPIRPQQERKTHLIERGGIEPIATERPSHEQYLVRQAWIEPQRIVERCLGFKLTVEGEQCRATHHKHAGIRLARSDRLASQPLGLGWLAAQQ